MRLKLLAIVLLVVVGLGAVAIALIGPGASSGAEEYITAQATRTTVSADVVATGSVAAHATYGLGFGAPPQLASSTGSGSGGTSTLVETVDVKVGDKVTAGQILATAATGDLEVQLAIAKANLAVARANLIADRGGPAADVLAAANEAIAQAQLAYRGSAATRASTASQNALTLAQAERAVAQARDDLATAQAGPSADVIASAQDGLTAAQLSLQNAQQNLASTQAQNDLSVSQAQQALASAQSQLDVANQKLATDQAADPPVDATVIAADQASVSQAQGALASAQRSLDTTTLNAQKSDQQAQQQVSSAQLSLASAQRSYDSKAQPSADSINSAQRALQAAEDNLAATSLKTGQSSSQADQQVAQARLSLSSARTGYSTKTARATAQQIAADEAQVASAEASVSTAQLSLDRARITSPIDGIVVAVNIEVAVAAPAGFAIVVQSLALDATAQFGESDLPSLSLGQPATVDVPATGEQLSGTVAQITPVATSSGASSVVSYAVVVALAETGGAVRTGMSADVSVTTQSVADVVAVPALALQGTSGSYTVRVFGAGGAVESRAVEVGLVTSSMAAISSGVNEGDTVVIGTRSQLAGSSTTQGGGFGAFPVGGGVRPGRGDGAVPNPGSQP